MAPGVCSAAEHFSPDLRLEPVHLDLAVAIDIGARRLDAVDFGELSVRFLDAGSSSYDGKAITLAWTQPFATGEERQVQLCYRVVAPVTGVTFSAPEPGEPDAPTFVITDHETERARYWLASLDHPSARPTLDIRLTSDARWTLLANGALQGEEQHTDGTKTARFVQS